MHGNDLRILAAGEGKWDEDVRKLEVNNPMSRDTFMLRAGGKICMGKLADVNEKLQKIAIKRLITLCAFK